MTRTMPYEVPPPGTGAITPAEVRDVLTEVINVVDDRGWIRCSGFTECPSLTNYDAGYDPDDHNTWPVSIRGAINVVCRGPVDIEYECGVADTDFDERVPVIVALVESLNLPVGDFPDEVLAGWECADGRTANEALAALCDCVAGLR